MKLSSSIFAFVSFLASLFRDTRGKEENPFYNLNTSTCMNYPNWTDGYGDSCTFYEVDDSPGCSFNGDSSAGDEGLVANEACCYCGGGIEKGDIVTPGSPSAGPTKDPTDFSCTYYLNWTDVYGDSCKWYELNDTSGCPEFGNDGFGQGKQGVANEACCYCGGGIGNSDKITPGSPSAGPTKIHLILPAQIISTGAIFTGAVVNGMNSMMLQDVQSLKMMDWSKETKELRTKLVVIAMAALLMLMADEVFTSMEFVFSQNDHIVVMDGEKRKNGMIDVNQIFLRVAREDMYDLSNNQTKTMIV